MGGGGGGGGGVGGGGNFYKFVSEKAKEILWLAKIRIRHFVVYSPRLENMEVQASMELQTQFFLTP